MKLWTRRRREVLLLFLLLLSSSLPPTNSRPIFDQLDRLSSSLDKARLDLNSVYTNWVDSVNSNAAFPSLLKGSTYVNTLYGIVNRTGLLVAGGGILFASTIFFLGETGALPTPEDAAKGVKDFRGWVSNLGSKLPKVNNNIRIPSLGVVTSLDSVDEKKDRGNKVFNMPGPPYNYPPDSLATSTPLQQPVRRNTSVHEFTSITTHLGGNMYGVKDPVVFKQYTINKPEPPQFDNLPPELYSSQIDDKNQYKDIQKIYVDYDEYHRTRPTSKRPKRKRPYRYKDEYPPYRSQEPDYYEQKSTYRRKDEGYYPYKRKPQTYYKYQPAKDDKKRYSDSKAYNMVNKYKSYVRGEAYKDRFQDSYKSPYRTKKRKRAKQKKY